MICELDPFKFLSVNLTEDPFIRVLTAETRFEIREIFISCVLLLDSWNFNTSVTDWIFTGITAQNLDRGPVP